MTRVFVLVAFLLAGSIPRLTAETPPDCARAGDSQAEDDVIFLQDSGSTNTAAFCYTVTRSGMVIRRMGTKRFQKSLGNAAPPPEQGNIPVSLAEKLFHDVETAMPLSALPLTHCIKSASFGTSRYIWFKGKRSPDLCGRDNEKVATLSDDFANVVRAAGTTRHGSSPPRPH